MKNNTYWLSKIYLPISNYAKPALALLAGIALSGCTSSPKIKEIESNQCEAGTRDILVNESTIKSNGKDVLQCDYEWVYKSSGHLMDILAPTYTLNRSTYYKYKGVVSPRFNDISAITSKEASDEKRKREIAKRKDKEKACQASKQCMSERKRKAQEQKQYTNVCKAFYEDLKTKTNFSYSRITLARPMLTGAYICVAQGYKKTPHGNRFEQVEITGNPENGAYNYK